MSCRNLTNLFIYLPRIINAFTPTCYMFMEIPGLRSSLRWVALLYFYLSEPKHVPRWIILTNFVLALYLRRYFLGDFSTMIYFSRMSASRHFLT